jgi:predicted kinase
MRDDEATLHLLCGKIASGKSTLATALGGAPGRVVLDQDAWLFGLFGDRMQTIDDYIAFSERLRALIGPHVVRLLHAGVAVVLDFPANTPEDRTWMRSLIDASGARHLMHVLDVPTEVCWQRLQFRNAEGRHPFQASRVQFEAITRHFSVPKPEEGFDLVWHEGSDG